MKKRGGYPVGSLGIAKPVLTRIDLLRVYLYQLKTIWISKDYKNIWTVVGSFTFPITCCLQNYRYTLNMFVHHLCIIKYVVDTHCNHLRWLDTSITCLFTLCCKAGDLYFVFLARVMFYSLSLLQIWIVCFLAIRNQDVTIGPRRVIKSVPLALIKFYNVCMFRLCTVTVNKFCVQILHSLSHTSENEILFSSWWITLNFDLSSLQKSGDRVKICLHNEFYQNRFISLIFRLAGLTTFF